MAGMIRQAKRTGVEHLIHEGNVHDYAPVGCLENTMVGNDRSGTVDLNLNLLKAVELALTGGYDLLPITDPMTGKTDPRGAGGLIPVILPALRHGRSSGTPMLPRPVSLFKRSSSCSSGPRQW